MKKLLNKLSNSGNLREETLYTGEEHLETHYRKTSTLPADVKDKDTPEEIKIKKSFSLSKATAPRYKDAVEAEDFSKKKSSSNGIKKEKEKTKDKLNESDDTHVRKSKSLKNVGKSPSSLRSPSLKSIFASPYSQQKDGKDVIVQSSDSDEEEEDDAFSPHQHPDFRDDDSFSLSSPPIRAPSAPARLASSTSLYPPTSPSFSHSHSPSPPSLVSLHARAASPTRPISPSSPSYSNSNSNSYSNSSSPPSFSSRPPSSFTQSPPSNVVVPTPHVIVASDTFGTHSDDFGSPFKFQSDPEVEFGSITTSGRVHKDSKLNDSEHFDTNKNDYDGPEEEEEIIHQKKSGLFSFGSNKPTKLKA